MTTPSLPQQENDQQQAERARALAWAQRQYTWQPVVKPHVSPRAGIFVEG